MAVPAPATPSGNAYTINVARPADEDSPLPALTAAGALLLRRWKVPVRMHVSGDNPRVGALREGLAAAGAKASAFSPAPSDDMPGEGFWKTTVTVVEADAGEKGRNFWAEERADKKVEWDPLLVALAARDAAEDLPARHRSTMIALPDLWCVSTLGASTPESAENLANRWVKAGAKAVCVLTATGVAWKSRGSVFGMSAGCRDQVGDSTLDNAQAFGMFSAGVLSGILRELLGENLFDKTLIRADRECLEMRPLRLGRAVDQGVAALMAIAAASRRHEAGRPNQGLSPETANAAYLQKGGGLAEAAEARLALLRGPEPKPWAHKGR